MGDVMDLKKLGLREWLVVIFILAGLVAFAFEAKFKPAILEVKTSAEGFKGDINLTVKAYKKKNQDIRIVKIDVEHEDTEAIAGPALSKLVDNVVSSQNFDVDIVAGASYTSEGFAEALEMAIEEIKSM